MTELGTIAWEVFAVDDVPETGRVRVTASVPEIRSLDGVRLWTGSKDFDINHGATEGGPGGAGQVSVPPSTGVDPIGVTYTVQFLLESGKREPVTGIVVAPGETVQVNQWTSVLPPPETSNAAHDAEVSRLAAEQSAADAAQSKTDAAQSEQAAADSADAAAQSKADAAQSKTGAAQSETNADQSEAAAAGSAGAAAQSEANAHQSEINAAASAAAAAAASGPTILTNLHRNPGLATSAANWTTSNFTANYAGSQNWRLSGQGVSAVFYLGPVGPGATQMPIAPGKYAQAAVRITPARDLDITPAIAFKNDANATIATRVLGKQPVTAGVPVTVGATDLVAPAGTTWFYLYMSVADTGSSTVAAGEALVVNGGAGYATDQPIGCSGKDLPVLYGGMTGVRWSGAANASTSEIYAPPVALLAALHSVKGGADYIGSGQPIAALGIDGATYRDIDATAGAVLWRKTAGVWKCIEGDTGVRNIGALHVNGWTDIGGTMVRRVGDVVEVRVNGNNSSSSAVILNLPVGFRVTSNTSLIPCQSGFASITTTGAVSPGSATTAFRSGPIVYTTRDAWPATPVGTSA